MSRTATCSFYLIWRDISVRYKQTVLGPAWAIVQPLILMLIFTFLRAVRQDRLRGLPLLRLRFRRLDSLDVVLAGHATVSR